MNRKQILSTIVAPIFVASLCCLSPVIIVLLGLGSVAFASSLADSLYGDYKWYFRGAGLLIAAYAMYLHFKSKGVCTLDAAKRHRNEIINTILLVFTVLIIGYFFFLYVVVHYFGLVLNLWK